MNYEIGSRVGDYEILQILGAGGMGRVYKVRNSLSDRIEAMKVLLPDLEGTPGFADRFVREIKVQASLDHPNIAALHTAIRIDDQVLMLMEYVEGITLEKMMETGRIPIDKAADYIVQVLSALSYAHERGVIHRDLKPANMMVTASGLLKLMDFGIARMRADTKLTQTGSTVGSLYYMSPEQINGTSELDSRSDLYSLGVTLYEIVTGAKPFQGDSGYKIMEAHLGSKPLPPIQMSPDLPQGLSEIVMQALEKDPEKRFQSAEAFRTAMLHVCSPGRVAMEAPPSQATIVNQQKEVKPAPPAMPPPPTKPAPARRGLWIAVGALIVVAVIVAAAMQLPKFRQTTAEEIPAEEMPVTIPEDVTQTPEPVSNPDAVAPVPDTPSPVRSPAPARSTGTTRGSSYQEPAPSPQPPAEPVEDPGITEQLKEVRKQMDFLYMRSGTVNSSLDRLQRQQEASGFGLRADMVDAAQRMKYYFDQTETALNRRDAEAAKKNLDLAERELSKLENFLGR